MPDLLILKFFLAVKTAPESIGGYVVQMSDAQGRVITHPESSGMAFQPQDLLFKIQKRSWMESIFPRPAETGREDHARTVPDRVLYGGRCGSFRTGVLFQKGGLCFSL